MAGASSSAVIAGSDQRKHLLFSPKTLNPRIPSTLAFKSNQTLGPISISITSQSSNKRTGAAAAAAASLSPDPRSLKSGLAAGETLYGLFLLSSSPTVAEIAGLAGYDYVVVDMEHGPGGIAEALPCLRALAATRTPAILRLPEPSATWAKKALDLGPQGIMIPMIESPAAAELAVSFCRFPPRGVRGAFHTAVRASAYGIDVPGGDGGRGGGDRDDRRRRGGGRGADGTPRSEREHGVSVGPEEPEGEGGAEGGGEEGVGDEEEGDGGGGEGTVFGWLCDAARSARANKDEVVS